MALRDSLSSSFYERTFQVLVIISLTILVLYLGKSLFIPLVFAFLTSIVLYPLNQLLEKIHCPRYLAAIVSIVIFISLISVIFFLLGTQLEQFSKALPMLKEKLGVIFHNLQLRLQSGLHIDIARQANYIKKSSDALMASAGSTFSNLLSFIIMLVLFVFFTFYILSYRKLLMQFMLSFFNRGNKKKVLDTVMELRLMINSYIKGLLIEMTVVFITGFLLLLVLGIKFALLMAVFTALFNIIPYLGIFTSIFINVLITLATGTSTQGIEVAIVFIVIHLVDSNILLPKIVGKQVKMNPFITLIAVVIGELLWGIPGMFLFIPLSAIFRIISEKIKDLQPWAILIGEE